MAKEYINNIVMADPDSDFYTISVTILTNYLTMCYVTFLLFDFLESRLVNQYYTLMAAILIILALVSFGLAAGSNSLHQALRCPTSENALNNSYQYVVAVIIAVFISAWKWPQIPIVSIYTSFNPSAENNTSCCTLLKKYGEIVNKYDTRVKMFKYTTLFYLFWSTVYGVILGFGSVCQSSSF
jgi:hypothetical protein